jgi:nitrate reductase cytochrome c-type subunit
MPTATTVSSPASSPVPAAIPERIYSADRQQFASDFNERPFMVDHSLSGHGAFTMDRLHYLLERSLPIRDKVYWNAGKREIGQKWSDRPGRDFPIEEAFRRIRESDAWIIIFGADRDPEIHAMLEEGLKEVQELTGINFAREVKNMQSIVFITSPHRISEYHIDRECSMLLQIHGKKTIHIFDQNDREVLPEEEKERFWSVDNNAAIYKPQFQDRARSFLLEPGKAVHIPINAPHWLQNGDDISVSINQNFQFKNEKYANIYRANYYMRKLGLHPAPRGANPGRDHLKARAMNVPVNVAKKVSAIRARMKSA